MFKLIYISLLLILKIKIYENNINNLIKNKIDRQIISIKLVIYFNKYYLFYLQKRFQFSYYEFNYSNSIYQLYSYNIIQNINIMTEENLLYAADYFAFLGKKISDHEI